MSPISPPSNTLSAWKQTLFWGIIFVALGWFLAGVRPILLPFVVGILLAYFLNPVAVRLTQYRVPRALACILALLMFITALVGLLLMLVPILANQIQNFTSALPHYLAQLDERITPYWGQLYDYLGNMWSGIAAVGPQPGSPMTTQVQNWLVPVLRWAGDIVGGIWSNGLTLFNFLSLIVLTPVVAYYILRDWPKVVARIQDLFPKQHAPKIHQLMDQMDQTLSSFIRGQGTVCMILALFYGTGLSIVGLEFGSLIGIFIGLMAFIPFVGFIIGSLMGLTIALVQFDHWSWWLAVLGVFMVGQVIEGYILVPRLVGRSVGLNEAWVIFALLAGGTLLGFVGILVAVPMASILGVLVRFLIQEYKNSGIFQGT